MLPSQISDEGRRSSPSPCPSPAFWASSSISSHMDNGLAGNRSLPLPTFSAFGPFDYFSPEASTHSRSRATDSITPSAAYYPIRRTSSLSALPVSHVQQSTSSRPYDRSPVSLVHTSSPFSSTSAEEYLTTPSRSTYTPTIPPRNWSLPPSKPTDPKGLGFDLETDLMEAVSNMTLTSHLTPSSSSSGQATPTPANNKSYPNMLSPSEYMTELASPRTLEELRHLRRAARDLEMESKATFSPSLFSLPSTEIIASSTIQARRIKRKAVPALDLSLDTSVPSRPDTAASYLPSTPTFPKPMRVMSPISSPLALAPSPSSITSALTKRGSPSAYFKPPTSSPTPKKSFYGNILATRSCIDISPRSSSFSPFISSAPTSPAPAASPAPSASPVSSFSRGMRFRKHQRETSALSAVSDTESSSGSSFDDGLITPSALGPEDRSGKRLNSILGAFSASSVNLSLGISDIEGKKGKKSLTRFFRKTHSEV